MWLIEKSQMWLTQGNIEVKYFHDQKLKVEVHKNDHKEVIDV